MFVQLENRVFKVVMLMQGTWNIYHLPLMMSLYIPRVQGIRVQAEGEGN